MKISQQFFIFACVGAVATIAHYSVLVLLVQVAAQNPIIATTIGFIVGAMINYTLNYRLTFNSRKQHREALAKFLLVAGVTAVINTAIMAAGMTLFELHYLLIQLVATCFVLILNFTANKHWTFA